MGSWTQWLTAVQILGYWAAALVGGLLLRGFKAGKWVASLDHSERFRRFDERLDAHDRRLEDAGHRSSALASTVQGLPDKLRRERDEALVQVDHQVAAVRQNLRDVETVVAGSRAAAEERHLQNLRDHERFERDIDTLGRRRAPRGEVEGT